MHKKPLWLSISLFCSQSCWNRLLGQGIERFIRKLSKEELKAFQIKFNFSYGENIRLALLTSEEKAEWLAKHTDIYFKKFFRKALFQSPQNSNSTEPDIFMQMPSNTVQYGLFTVEQLLKSKSSFRQELSAIIIVGLSEERIDQETIVTFAFYLHIALLKVFIDNVSAMDKEVIDKFYNNSLDNDNATVDKTFLETTYQQNKNVLLEITNDIISQPSSNIKLPVWLERWMRLCQSEIGVSNLECEKEKLKYSNVENDDYYRRIMHLIDLHLGLNREMKLLINYYISKCLF